MGLGSMVQEMKASIATRATQKRVLEMLDHFHNNAQKVAGAGMTGFQLTRADSSETAGASDTTSDILDALYFQISLIAFLYGVLGLTLFIGVLAFARCTGKTKEIGWKHVILENMTGSRLPHFFAHLCCFIGGIIGFISPTVRSNKNLPLVLPILILLSSILNGTAKPEEKKTEDASSNSEASFRAPQPPPMRRNGLSLENFTFGSNESGIIPATQSLFVSKTALRRKKRGSDESSSEPKLSSPSEVATDQVRIEITPDETKHAHLREPHDNGNQLPVPHMGQCVSSEELDNDRAPSDLLRTEDTTTYEFPAPAEPPVLQTSAFKIG